VHNNREITTDVLIVDIKAIAAGGDWEAYQAAFLPTQGSLVDQSWEKLATRAILFFSEVGHKPSGDWLPGFPIFRKCSITVTRVSHPLLGGRGSQGRSRSVV
jgi:hypothetical protein